MGTGGMRSKGAIILLRFYQEPIGGTCMDKSFQQSFKAEVILMQVMLQPVFLKKKKTPGRRFFQFHSFLKSGWV